MCFEQLPSGMFRKQTCLILDTFVHSRTLPSNFEHLRQISDGTTRFLIFMSISGRDRQILNMCQFSGGSPRIRTLKLISVKTVLFQFGRIWPFPDRSVQFCPFALLSPLYRTIASTYFKLLNARLKSACKTRSNIILEIIFSCVKCVSIT